MSKQPDKFTSTFLLIILVLLLMGGSYFIGYLEGEAKGFSVGWLERAIYQDKKLTEYNENYKLTHGDYPVDTISLTFVGIDDSYNVDTLAYYRIKVIGDSPDSLKIVGNTIK